MKALRFIDGRLSLDEVAMPDSAGETLVRVVRSGVCNTDLEIVRGYAGFSGTIGHEFVGVVEASDEDPSLIGKRVVGEINAGCGVCRLCSEGDPRHCADRTVLGIAGRQGAHAEYLSLPARNLLEVPDTVSDDEAVFTEPLAAALGIAEQVEIRRETRVAVIGDGKLGLLCALGAGLSSDAVTIVGKHKAKTDIAAAAGIEPVMSGEIQSLGRAFDVVIEASGSESGFADAMSLVRPRGKIVLKSTFHGTPRWEAWRIVVDEISVVGSRCGRFADALEVLRDGRVDVKRLIADRFSLAEGETAMSRAGEKGVLKVLLEM